MDGLTIDLTNIQVADCEDFDPVDKGLLYEFWGCSGCNNWKCYEADRMDCLKGHDLARMTYRSIEQNDGKTSG